MEARFVPFGNLCILTREQFEDMRQNGFKAPLRFMGKCHTGPAALAEMRYLSEYFNDLCVWDIQRQLAVGMISQDVPLLIDNLAPPFSEFVIAFGEEPADRLRSTKRRPYAYPHPSGIYER